MSPGQECKLSAVKLCCCTSIISIIWQDRAVSNFVQKQVEELNNVVLFSQGLLSWVGHISLMQYVRIYSRENFPQALDLPGQDIDICHRGMKTDSINP